MRKSKFENLFAMARYRCNAQEVHDILMKDAASDSEDDVSEDSSAEEDNLSDEVADDISDEASSLDEEVESMETETVESHAPPARGRRGCSRGHGGTTGNIRSRGRGRRLIQTDSSDTPPTRSLPSNHGRGLQENSNNDTNARVSTTWVGKDGCVWHKQPLKQAAGRQRAANVIHSTPGPTRFALRNVGNPLTAFELFFRNSFLKDIQKWTNKEGGHIYGENWKDITEEELRCFLGLSILSGVYKSRNEAVRQLWSKDDGRPIFNKSMPRDRFQQISRALRFDDAAHRRVNQVTDKLAPIRSLFDIWESTLRDAFVPGENVTIDEQLLTFRGRVPFRQYIPSKPGKYGIKLWMLCDSKTSYVYRLQVYTGKTVGQGREQNQGERVVLDLTQDMQGSGRNVTTDNFFTSLSLSKKLSQRKITLLGTVRKNRRELPAEFVTTKGRQELSSIFAFSNDGMLVSYSPKRGKVVVLFSSMHNQPQIDASHPGKKPQIILDYNGTKGGVDTADQMLRMYTTKRMTRRWPMAIFYNMIDISALNAFIVWISLNPEWEKQTRHKRRLFLLELGKSLIRQSSVDIDNGRSPTPIREPPKKRVRCSYCPRDKDRKCSTVCTKCGKNICKEHSKNICPNC